MVYLNEVSERRKKKDLLFEERSDEFLFQRNRRRQIFPVVRRPSRIFQRASSATEGNALRLSCFMSRTVRFQKLEADPFYFSQIKR